MQLGQEHFQKGINCDVNHLKAETLKADNELKSEESLDFALRTQASDQSISADKQRAYAHSNVDVVTVGYQNVNKVAPCSVSLPQFEMVKKETEFYADKAVTEIEQPKMIVCYKEGSYHIIKDICVDEGLHSFDSIVVQNVVNDEKAYGESKFDINNFTSKDISGGLKSSILNGQNLNNDPTEDASLGSVPEECGDVSQTTGDINSSGSQEKNFDVMLILPQEPDTCQSEEQIVDIHHKNTTQRSLASLLEEDRGNTDTAEEAAQSSETKELLLEQELDRDCCSADPLSCESSIDQPPLINGETVQQKSISSNSEDLRFNQVHFHPLISVSGNHPDLESISENTAKTFSVQDSNQADQVGECALEEANSTPSGVSSKELKEENDAKYLPVIGDSRDNIIAFDSNYEQSDTVLNKDHEGMSESKQPGPVTNNSMLEDTCTDGPTSSSRPSFSHGHADAIFPGPVSLSGRIIYSGQVPYSGSISLRSDSSTTSTRSFAFPILQSEWNSSPVRMAKADRRHFRRQRGWRSGLLCCRF